MTSLDKLSRRGYNCRAMDILKHIREQVREEGRWRYVASVAVNWKRG